MGTTRVHSSAHVPALPAVACSRPCTAYSWLMITSLHRLQLAAHVPAPPTVARARAQRACSPGGWADRPTSGRDSKLERRAGPRHQRDDHEEMHQPCLVYVHVISLVARHQRDDQRTELLCSPRYCKIKPRDAETCRSARWSSISQAGTTQSTTTRPPPPLAASAAVGPSSPCCRGRPAACSDIRRQVLHHRTHPESMDAMPHGVDSAAHCPLHQESSRPGPSRAATSSAATGHPGRHAGSAGLRRCSTR